MINYIFSTPIFYEKLVNNKKHCEHLRKVAEEIRREDNDISDLPWNCNVWSTFSFDAELHRRREFHNVAYDITEAVRRFAVERQFKDDPEKIVMTNLFLNYQEKYQYQEYHDHRESVLSGVFYIDVPEETGMDIILKTPLKANHDDIWFEEHHSNEVFKISPENGDLLIFPSWLDHGVQANLSDKPRINIAFNFNVIGFNDD